MAKKKVTECQKLINEVDQEAREKLQKRFKEAVKRKLDMIEQKKESIRSLKVALQIRNRDLSSAEEDLYELKKADLDKWGKENPEPKSFNAKIVSSLTFRESQQDSIDSLRYLLSNMKQMPMGLYPVSHGL